MIPKLYTQVQIPESEIQIDYADKILMMGSCFADNIGEKLQQLKFKTIHNPFGVIYNPFSLANNLDIILNKKEFTEQDLRYYNELWYSFSHHSNFSSTDKHKGLERINQNIKESFAFIKNADLVFLTFGTSRIYKHLETNQVVNNCHKIPASQFKQDFLIPDQIVEQISQTIKQIKNQSENVKIVLTVSPIRHLKDGAIENQRSKASLILAVKELENRYDFVSYFPAYEIFMDELRDYRYYDTDMVHPSSQAIDYIWDKFSDTYFSDETKGIIKKIEAVITGLNHRPRFPETEAYKKFVSNLRSKIDAIKLQEPDLDFSSEEKLITFNKS